MATTRLTDVVQIPVYDSYIAINNPSTSRFVTSGVVAVTPITSELANANAIASTVPFWNDLDPSIEPNYSNDDPADIATANKITTGMQNVRKAFMNQIYGAMDLTRELAGSDPMIQIKNRFGVYWQRQLQKRAIASALGLMNDNVANDAGDMTVNIAQESTGADATHLFSRDAFVNAAFTLGDQFDSIAAIAMHSVVYKRLVKNNDIDFIPDSEGKLSIPSYMGADVIIDDDMPVIAGTTSGFKYVTVLFGRGAFGFGDSTSNALVPSWVYRLEAAGNGGGMEEIGERKEWVLHPNGFSWIEGTLTEFSPTLADLKLAAHWDRKVFRKQARMAFLITNG